MPLPFCQDVKLRVLERGNQTVQFSKVCGAKSLEGPGGTPPKAGKFESIQGAGNYGQPSKCMHACEGNLAQAIQPHQVFRRQTWNFTKKWETIQKGQILHVSLAFTENRQKTIM